MKTELENVSSIKRKLKVEVPAPEVGQAYQESVSKIQKKAKIKGFREGKVPPAVVEKQFAAEIQQEAMERVVQKSYPKALEELKVFPVSQPRVIPGTFSKEKEFSYTAEFEIRPEIVVKNYKGLKLEREKVDVDPKMVEGELTRLQQQMTQLEPTPEETLSAKGHVLTVDFSGVAEGQKFEGSESKDFALELGAKGLLPDFENGLIGLKKGEKKNLKFDYPKDYFNKALAGKKAEFNVTVKDIRKKNVPVLNDDFAKDLGQYKTLVEVKADIQKRIADHLENDSKGKLFRKILEELSKSNPFEVPESMVLSELNNMIETLARDLSSQGKKLDDLNVQELYQQHQPEAEFRVRSFLLLDKISELESVLISEEEVDQFIATQAASLKRPAEEVKAYYIKNRLLDSLKLRLLHEKTLEFVLNQAKIKETNPKKEANPSKKGG